MTQYTKPLPGPDERTAPYWSAAKEHRLAIQRCQDCGHYSHPPVILCPNCNALEPSFAWETVSGQGKIVSWTVYHDAFVPSFTDDIPWVNVVVELAEQKGLWLMATLVDGPQAPLKLAAPVEVLFDDVTPEVTLPKFKLSKR